jgi:hypothetical protein
MLNLTMVRLVTYLNTVNEFAVFLSMRIIRITMGVINMSY